MKNKIKWLIRLFMWFLGGFGVVSLKLDFIGGSDYIHPFAPYSFEGIKRKTFFELMIRKKCGEVLGRQTIELHKYGALHLEISREKFLEIGEHSRIAYQYFLSPWKINYNHK